MPNTGDSPSIFTSEMTEREHDMRRARPTGWLCEVDGEGIPLLGSAMLLPCRWLSERCVLCRFIKAFPAGEGWGEWKAWPSEARCSPRGTGEGCPSGIRAWLSRPEGEGKLPARLGSIWPGRFCGDWREQEEELGSLERREQRKKEQREQ